MGTILSDGPVSYYQQLYTILRDELTRGKWKPGERMPSETELIAAYGVSRITVRQAFDLLVNDGFVYRRRGSGTFVTARSSAPSLNRILSFTRTWSSAGCAPRRGRSPRAWNRPRPTWRGSWALNRVRSWSCWRACVWPTTRRACLRAVMEAAGYKCHVYTWPHLLKFNERIRLAGEVISDEYLIGMMEEVKRVNDGEPISFFEITTAVAFLAFSRVPADVVLMEVDMGGLNDATNLVCHPFMTIITTISYDHVDWLGRTLPEIARQKAGIMKPGVPCVVGHQLDWARAEVMPVFEAQAKALNAPLIVSGDTAVIKHYNFFDLSPWRIPSNYWL